MKSNERMSDDSFRRIAQTDAWEQFIASLFNLTDPEEIEDKAEEIGSELYERVRQIFLDMDFNRFINEHTVKPVGSMVETWDGREPDTERDFHSVRYYATVSYYEALVAKGHISLQNSMIDITENIREWYSLPLDVESFLAEPVVREKILENLGYVLGDDDFGYTFSLDDERVEDLMWQNNWIEVDATAEEVKRYQEEDEEGDVWGPSVQLRLYIRHDEENTAIVPFFDNDVLVVDFSVPIRVDVRDIFFPGDNEYDRLV